MLEKEAKNARGKKRSDAKKRENPDVTPR